MLENINLFNGLNDKMAYLAQRQKTLATNISNADTPGFRPNDLKTPDFASVMRVSAGNTPQLPMAKTAAGHVSGLTRVALGNQEAKEIAQRRTYEVSPTGNAVDIEEQMMKSSQTNMDYQLITNLYGKNMDLLRSAMRGQR